MDVRVPAVGWVRRYERGWLRGDLLAGVTVTAYLVPQVMAYADLRACPQVTGLWAAIGALMVYAVLGSSQRLSVGPESTTALMTAAALGSVTTAATSPAAMASGARVRGGRLLPDRLDSTARRASRSAVRPVLIGYLAGIAGIMVVSQFGKLLGIEVQGEGFFTELGYVPPDMVTDVPTLRPLRSRTRHSDGHAARGPHVPQGAHRLAGHAGGHRRVAVFDLR